VEKVVILVDTNAWVQHLRKADPKLIAFLRQQRVRTCDIVIGELLLGAGLPTTFAQDLAALPKLPSPAARETRSFIERHSRSYAGAGVGWADAQILLCAARTGARLYTSDRSVRRVCVAIDVALA
jgi:predicted nucleic acid-binding protein